MSPLKKKEFRNILTLINIITYLMNFTIYPCTTKRTLVNCINCCCVEENGLSRSTSFVVLVCTERQNPSLEVRNTSISENYKH